MGRAGHRTETHRPSGFGCPRRGMAGVTTMLKPRAVPPDAQGAIVCPASTPQAERVELGLEALRMLGYAPQKAEPILTRGPLYFAGTPQVRLSDLHHA